VSSNPTVVERLTTDRGELVLRAVDGHFEVISNGTFLMDTRNGESERLLVTAAIDQCKHPAAILIGGLGVGFSVVPALEEQRVERVVVVEIEPAIVAWHRTHLASTSSGSLDDPRVTIVIGDLIEELRSTTDRYDAICLDIDNGPDWTVTAANYALYDEDGTSLVASRLARDGVLSVWSAARSAAYETVLRRHFHRVDVHEIDVARGEPDVVMVAVGPL
jgi:spermidine synthase